jgi:outer membrane phospholipase A
MGTAAARTAALLLVALATPGSGWAADGQPPSTEEAPAAEQPGPDEERFQRFASKLSPHEPLYFVMGSRDGLDAKFQISFRYRFLDPEGGVARRVPLLRHLHLGYTQTSLWDLESESAPFFDTSYRPSLFILRDRVHTFAGGAGLGLRYGLEHESNGQGGDESRSLNIAYVQPVLSITELAGGRLRFAPKVYAYIGDLSDNPDIADYRGWVDLRVDWMRPDGVGLAATLRKGGESSSGSVQADLSYPLDRILGGNLEAFVHLQYFNGWGETLRTYDQKLPAQLRLGIMVVR